MSRTLEEPLLHPEAKRSLTDQEIKKVQKETYLNVSVFSYMFFGWLSKYIEVIVKTHDMSERVLCK